MTRVRRLGKGPATPPKFDLNRVIRPFRKIEGGTGGACLVAKDGQERYLRFSRFADCFPKDDFGPWTVVEEWPGRSSVAACVVNVSAIEAWVEEHGGIGEVRAW